MSDSEVIEYECAHCDNEFEHKSGASSVQCPGCDSFATSPKAYDPY